RILRPSGRRLGHHALRRPRDEQAVARGGGIGRSFGRVLRRRARHGNARERRRLQLEDRDLLRRTRDADADVSDDRRPTRQNSRAARGPLRALACRAARRLARVDVRSVSAKPAVSSGLLLFRRTPRGLEVFLAHPGGPFWAGRDGGAWTIPKGAVESGED